MAKSVYERALTQMFFVDLQRYGGNTALISESNTLSYQQLDDACEAFQKSLPKRTALGFLFCQNDAASVVAYLSCLRQGLPILLLDAGTAELVVERLTEAYQPEFVIRDGKVSISGYDNGDIDNNLALLLSTSGSTGSPKQVALSKDNLSSNASSIAEYLSISETDVAISSLPLFYSYGLSVLNSHLHAGAALVLTQDSVMTRGFWQSFTEHQVTSLAGVPHSYQMLIKLGFFRKSYPHLRYLTQAGGKLDVASVVQLAEYARDHGIDFYVMYGQTEATARIAYLAPDKALSKPDSIGAAIPGGRLSLVDPDSAHVITSPNQKGELVYRGRNVMLGYVTARQELEKITPLEVLHTGDLAYADEDGDYFIAGRLKRIVKIVGKRTSLDDVEQILAGQGILASVIGNDEALSVVSTESLPDRLSKELGATLGLHPNFIRCITVEKIPMTDNGKVDYSALSKLLESRE